MRRSHPERRPAREEVLDPATMAVDEELILIEREIDWLAHLSPTGNAARWAGFVASGHRRAPPLTYGPVRCDVPALRARLDALPLDKPEHAMIAALLREKARELEAQLDLVEMRGTDGVAAASVALFGAPTPALLLAAETILAEVPPGGPEPLDAGAAQMEAASIAMGDALRARDPSLRFDVRVVDDLSGMLMVHHGDLLIDGGMRAPSARVAPLVAHEVGVHVVTRHNGRRQPLRQLECGLAHYDALQEGLATLAEWLAGYLPPDRLRVLAARVLAADLALRGEVLEAIWAALHEQHGLPADDAFDTAVRAKRGGALTKDAVYLEGLSELLAHLAAGGELETLMLGKFALPQLPVMERLMEDGVVHPPDLLPLHLTTADARERIERARETPLAALHQSAPDAPHPGTPRPETTR